ncbi:MAG: nicotinate-nucleotide adenylyltransferase [Kiritimatiellae bacterium]|nr:nicotinate-nucleotide adenylyltransferase [Kiritimatiellia bacterium]
MSNARADAAPARIAILGGSFDPVHNGHLSLAAHALRILGASRLWFIPASESPLKPGSMRATSEDRLAMLRLATRHEPRFGVSDCELRRGGVSFTVETLRRWKALHPVAELCFIAGMDSLLSLWRWRSPLEILELCRFVTFRRPGSAVTPLPDDLHLPPRRARALIADIADAPMLDVSSSLVRDRLERGLDTSPFLHPDVLRYIRARGLYRR